MKRCLLFLSAIALLICGKAIAATDDPLAAEIARWKHFVEGHESSGEDWKSMRDAVAPLLAKAEQATVDGRPYVALQR